jgi:hypothetical protein
MTMSKGLVLAITLFSAAARAQTTEHFDAQPADETSEDAQEAPSPAAQPSAPVQRQVRSPFRVVHPGGTRAAPNSVTGAADGAPEEAPNGIRQGDADSAPGGHSPSAAKTAAPLPAGSSTGGCPILASSTNGIASYTRLTGQIMAHYFGAGDMLADPTQFGSIMGRTARFPDMQPLPWPGFYGALFWIHLPVNSYMSLAFTVTPASLNGPTQGNQAMYGRYTIGEDTSAGGVKPPLSMSISTRCGDFSPVGSSGSTVVPDCLVNRIGADRGLGWRKSGPAGPGICALSPGTYYLNVINADISKLTSGGGGSAASTKDFFHRDVCAGDGCDVELLNGFGSWINPVVSGPVSTFDTPAVQADNALICSGGTLKSGHMDFFSPMPPSCSRQGLQAGQSCAAGKNCPL